MFEYHQWKNFDCVLWSRTPDYKNSVNFDLIFFVSNQTWSRRRRMDLATSNATHDNLAFDRNTTLWTHFRSSLFLWRWRESFLWFFFYKYTSLTIVSFSSNFLWLNLFWGLFFSTTFTYTNAMNKKTIYRIYFSVWLTSSSGFSWGVEWKKYNLEKIVEASGHETGF